MTALPEMIERVATPHPGLLPCPFCGESRIYLNPPGTDHRSTINCPACLACIPEECGQDEMVATWNARVSGWHPIETAPKDGTFILAVRFDQFHESEPSLVVGAIVCWSRLSEAWFSQAVGRYLIPTHWMPLPAPPKMLTYQPGEIR